MHPHPDISEILSGRIDAGDFPSAVYIVWEKGEVRYDGSLGNAVVEPEVIPARLDTIYDLASLTKALVPTLLAAKLLEDGALQNDDAIARFLTETDLGDKGGIRIGDLFTHTTGLPGWIPFYLLVARREDILDEIVRTPFNADRNTVLYGDPNFWLVTFVLERILGTTIDDAARDVILGPLGLKDTMFNPHGELKPRLAAQERGTAFERQLCRDLGYDLTVNPVTGESPFRDEPIWGELHDNNGWYFGGVGGHAGLFSTAGEVLEMATQFLPRYSRLLKPETCGIFSTHLTPGRNEDRSFGFELASTTNTTAGTLMSPQ
ncbi:MAG TPA: serine hydrolase domain-containing protein, partial [Pyrinomonadaceae bacterium]|nr:serine hydrolase domain-containing protein [Pyrinomonadaceae bacterium]